MHHHPFYMKLIILYSLLAAYIKHKIPCLMPLIMLLLILSPLKLYCYSGPFHVAANGSDTNNGTFTNPFLTIQHAVDLMSTGLSNCTTATTYIFPGTYSNQIQISSNYNSGNMVLTALSNNNPPILNGPSASNGIQISNTGYVIISHLVIKHYNNGIFIKNNSTNIRIINNAIYSNNNEGILLSGINIFNNYIGENTIYGANQEAGICITNGYNNTIVSNIIYQNKKGVYLNSNASNNNIRKNTIYSNNIYGIEINSDNNHISENIIQGTNQNIGIYINQAKKNTVKLNTIVDHDFYGIILRNSTNNNLIKNTLYSHNIANIFLTNCNHNLISKNKIQGTSINGIYIRNGDENVISSNNIYNNSTNGVSIRYGNNNLIFSNRIYSNYYGIRIKDGINNTVLLNRINDNTNGISLRDNVFDTGIIKNDIYQNHIYGIDINSSTSESNIIITNIIHGENQDIGIYINNSDNNKIYRNLIRNNQNYNIYVDDATNIKIINNTIFHSINKDGVFWTNASSGKMYNNIILSNGNSVGDFGIKVATNTIGPVIVAFNNFYGNKGGPTNGNVNWSNGNTFGDPMIDTTSTFEILKEISAAVDSGTNIYIPDIPGVTNNVKGGARDMGWKESTHVLTDVPPKPHISECRAINCCEIVLRWGYLSAASCYTLFRNTQPKTNSAKPIASFQYYDMTHYLDTSAHAETNYYYWVKAYNRFGPSPFSDMAEVLTPSIYYPVTFAVFPTVFYPEIHGHAKIFFNEKRPEVNVTIYDTAGNIVWEKPNIKGQKFIEWNGKDGNGADLSVGVYIVYIKGDSIDEIIKMVLMH